MTVQTTDARYSIEIRDINGNRNTMIFENQQETYEYCLNMSNHNRTNEYEILNVAKYENILGHTYAMTLYSSLNHTTFSANWDDILGYFA